MGDRVLLSPREVQQKLGIGHTTFWQLVKQKKFRIRKLGKLSKVHVDDLNMYIDTL
jgi:excisionase family DNA binding protein